VLLQSFSAEVATSYGIREELFKVLRLYISRAIYSRIHPLCFNFQHDESVALDAKLYKQLYFLRKLKPDQLDPSLALVCACVQRTQNT
jgi:hypothetical protein